MDHGKIRGYFAEWDAILEDIQFDADDCREAPNRAVAMGEVRGRGKAAGTPVAAPLMLACVFEGDQVARVEEYLGRAEALEAARAAGVGRADFTARFRTESLGVSGGRALPPKT